MESRAVQIVWLTAFWLWFVLPIVGGLLLQRGRPILRSPRRRQQRPGHPDDCPLCGEAKLAVQPDAVSVRQPVEPWSTCKSRRGRKKSLATEGVACPNPDCEYAGIGDSAVHAIVGDGQRGVTDAIQYWRCQCCGRRFGSRLGTPLYRLKTPPRRVAEVMIAFAEGVDVSAAHRIFGHDERTLSDWLRKGNQHAERIQEWLFRDLHCAHLQLDGLVTRVRTSVQRVWVWASITTQTKLIPVVHIGRRKRADSMRFVHRPKAGLASGCVPIVTTDGLATYFTALTAHFGRFVHQPGKRKPVWQVDPQLLYAQLYKIRQGRKLQYAITEVVWHARAVPHGHAGAGLHGARQHGLRRAREPLSEGDGRAVEPSHVVAGSDTGQFV
jgi:transposase-like protein